MKIVLAAGGFPSAPDTVRDALAGDEVITVAAGAAFDDGVADAEVALGSPDPDRMRALVRAAPRLRWLHTVSAGVDRLMIPEIVERDDLTLTNNSGAYDVPIAEHVLGSIFTIAKRVREHAAAQSRREWQRDLGHAELHGATLVVLGMGSIGGELARLASGLGMHVIGVRRHAHAEPPPGVTRVVGMDALAEVAGEADHLAITAPLTPATRGSVSAAVIERMRPTAWIINIARGEIADEAALLAACRDGRIGGAAIDAWWHEPLPEQSEWWSLPNVIVTPHVSWSSPRVRERTLELFVENLRRYKAGEPLVNVVDKREGY